jgi:homogentisate 1,2-dioxygenase
VGDTSLIYHLNPPSALSGISNHPLPDDGLMPNDPLSPIHLRPHQLDLKKGDAVLDRVALLGNEDVVLLTAVATAESVLYKNASGDELVYIESGSGTLLSGFGSLPFGEGDYVIVPTSIIHQWVPNFGEEVRMFIVQAFGHINPPARYLSAHGQFLEGSPYCELDIRRPEELVHRAGENVDVFIRHRTGMTRNTHRYHPFDVVGWHGGMYPWALNIRDFEPITGRGHQPPPMHQVFEGPNFVMCNFVPRKVDYHPLAIPVPPFHANVDSDEVLLYTGSAKTREGTNVDYGSITLHPAGFIHGPHPGSVEKSIGVLEVNEYQVMVDTFRPLQVAGAGRDCLDADYPYSWDQGNKTAAS